MSRLLPFAETFVPLFVAMSPLTVLPIFLGMTQNLDQVAARRLARQAVLTGFVIAIAIVLVGQALFSVLGITLDDLRIAGGIILLVIAVYDLIFSRAQRKASELGSDAGVVPLGTPLIVGPATMTACIVLADSHGRPMVILALLINLLIIAVILHYARRIEQVVSPSVSKAFGKVMSLFLAAIAVAMFRNGVLAFVQAA
jgi:multiple antibiotic resistance protein